MKKTNIIYWIFTGLLILMMLGASVPDLLHLKEAVEGFKKLGYPEYLLNILGVARILGVIGIQVKGYPRVTEWAYAGFTIDIVGGILSGMAVGPLSAWLPVFVPLLVIAGSYIYYHKRLKMEPLKSSR
ncbi:DoxX family protein [soil metagenome]|jgi:hypothetical protein